MYMIKLTDKTREQYTKIILSAIHEKELIDFRHTFLDLHPSDQIDIFITLKLEDRLTVYTLLYKKEITDIFGGLKFTKQVEYFDEMQQEYASYMFNNMFTDDIVNFLSRLVHDRSETILQSKIGRASCRERV